MRHGLIQLLYSTLTVMKISKVCRMVCYEEKIIASRIYLNLIFLLLLIISNISG